MFLQTFNYCKNCDKLDFVKEKDQTYFQIQQIKYNSPEIKLNNVRFANLQ